MKSQTDLKIEYTGMTKVDCNNNNGTALIKEELRTLFVSGLPQDTRERDFHLLLQSCRGYEGAILKHPCRLTRVTKLPGQQPQGPVAFLSFATRKDAECAKEQFQGFHMDPNVENLTMKIEFAKANTKSRYRHREMNSLPSTMSFLPDAAQALQPTFPLFQPQLQHCTTPTLATPVAIDTGAVWPFSYQSDVPMDAGFSPVLFPSDSLMPLPERRQQSFSLIVSNLKDTVRENQLGEIFGRFPGYLGSRMTSVRGTAIVEYTSEPSAHVAIGCILGRINIGGREVGEDTGLKVVEGSLI